MKQAIWIKGKNKKNHTNWQKNQCPIPYMATHKQGNKETSNNQRPKNKMKAKPIEF